VNADKADKTNKADKADRAPVQGQTLASNWAHFSREILDPVQAGVTQRVEMRRAFYAGAASMWALMFEAMEPEDEEVCELGLKVIQDEMEGWIEVLKKGKA
jgi:hypothetical protein